MDIHTFISDMVLDYTTADGGGSKERKTRHWTRMMDAPQMETDGGGPGGGERWEGKGDRRGGRSGTPEPWPRHRRVQDAARSFFPSPVVSLVSVFPTAHGTIRDGTLRERRTVVANEIERVGGGAAQAVHSALGGSVSKSVSERRHRCFYWLR